MTASRTILVTGATDGIGLETAKRLQAAGHRVLLHGRNAERLERARQLLAEAGKADGSVEGFLADLSRLPEVAALAQAVAAGHERLDGLINNAGVLKTPQPVTPDGLDVRFVVNTLAPWLLTRRLLPLLRPAGRVVNVASAAQAPVDTDALQGGRRLADMEAYAQSKLALIMWTRHLARTLGPDGPVVVAVNPGSLLASKMVREGFGIAGHDLGIGAGILVRAVVGDDFADASGRYFDNDAGRFADPHPFAMDDARCAALVDMIEELVARQLSAPAED